MKLVARQQLIAWSVPMAVEAMALARSVILARVVGPEELGKTILLALVLRLVEMMSDLGFDRLLVQSPKGATRALQAQLHGAMLLRGIALAGLLVMVAPLLAFAFPGGPGWPVYAALAVVPLLRGAMHLDYRRAERRFDYRPMAVVELGSSTAMLAGLAGGVLAGITDHRVLLAALGAHALAQVILTHLTARRPWQISLNRDGLLRIWRFGAPLVVNAALMFLTLQADRFIVAGFWDWSDLAVYGVVAQLAFLPALIVGRATMSMKLPAFRAARSGGNLDNVVGRTVASHGILAGLFAAAFALIAPAAIEIVYGAAMRPGFALSAAFGLAAGFRIWRTPLSVLAVATGRTGDPARANTWRAVGLLPGICAAALGQPLAVFAATAALGEAAAMLKGLALARQDGNSSTQTKVLAQ